MPFSATFDSSLTGIRFVEETTPGVTPATPAMRELEITGESLNNTRDTIASSSFRSDRQVPGTTIVSESSTGDLNVELKYSPELQLLWESALQGTWVANSISNGTDRTSFTIEKQFGGDAGTGERFQVFRGCEVATMSLDMTVGSFITSTLNIISRGYTTGNATVANSTIAASTNPFMNSVDSGIVVKINDVEAADDVLQAFNFTLDNNMREQRSIGSADLAGIGTGRSSITGGMTVYFNGGANPIYTAYKSKVPVKLSIEIPDTAGNTLVFTFWKVDILSATQVAGGLDQDVVLECTTQASLGGPDSKTLTIERIPA